MMDTSPDIAELAKALVKAQGEFESVAKGASNPFFKSKYADLPSVVQAAAPILASNGLAVLQSIGFFEDNDTLTTRLVHESGQWIEDIMRLYLTKKDSQGMGSATTYARRYSYMAILGLVADDDDDGNSASVSAQPASTKSEGTTTKRAAPKVDTPATTNSDGPNLVPLFAIKGRDGKSIVPQGDDERHAWAGKILGRTVDSFKSITDPELEVLKKAAKEEAKKQPRPADAGYGESEEPF